MKTSEEVITTYRCKSRMDILKYGMTYREIQGALSP